MDQPSPTQAQANVIAPGGARTGLSTAAICGSRANSQPETVGIPPPQNRDTGTIK